MFTGSEIAETLERLRVTHAIWLPDSELGQWEQSLNGSASIELVRVCREGEAWPLAAGLYLGGKSPVVVLQTTGLFESGDALRNILYDLELPLFAIVGGRNLQVPDSQDSARRYAMPVLDAWGLDYVMIDSPDQKLRLAEHYLACQRRRRAGAVLLAEGKP